MKKKKEKKWEKNTYIKRGDGKKGNKRREKNKEKKKERKMKQTNNKQIGEEGGKKSSMWQGQFIDQLFIL